MEVSSGGPQSPQDFYRLPNYELSDSNRLVSTKNSQSIKINSNKDSISNDKVRIIHTYNSYDFGPYIVFIQREDNQKVGLHPMIIGKLLHKNNIKNIVGITKKGKHRVACEFNLYEDANSFISHPLLKENKLTAFIPKHLVSCQGVVRLETVITDDDIINNMRCGNRRILQVRRMHRRIQQEEENIYVPTKSVVITFSTKNLPKHIVLFNSSAEVTKYIIPVTLCYNCLAYGHTKTNCKNLPKCQHCSSEINDDSHKNCPHQLMCLHCQAPHQTTSKDCPEYKRQRRIKEIMAFENITFYEANLKVPKTTWNDPAEKSFRSLSLPQSFPSLSSIRENSTDEIELATSKTLQGYSRAVKTSTPKTRKTKQPISGYDVEAHRACVQEFSFSPTQPKRPIYESPIYQQIIQKADLELKEPSASDYINDLTQLLIKSGVSPDQLESALNALEIISKIVKKTDYGKDTSMECS